MTSHSCKISTLKNTNCVPKKYYFRCVFFLFILRRIFSLLTVKMRHLIFQAKTTFSDVQHWHVTKPIYTLPIPCAHTWYVCIWVFYLPQFSCVSLSLSKCVYRFYPRLYTRLLAIHKCMEKWAPAVLLAIHCMGVEYILFAFLAQLHVHQTVRFYISLFGNTHSHNEPRVLCAPVLFSLFIIVFPRFRFLSAFVRWLYHHHCCLPWFNWMNSYTHAHSQKRATSMCVCATHTQLQMSKSMLLLLFFPSFTRYARTSYRWRQSVFMLLNRLKGRERERNRVLCVCTENNCQMNSYCVVILNGVRKKNQTHSQCNWNKTLFSALTGHG